MNKEIKWFSYLFQEGYREMPRGWTFYIFVALAIALSVFELWLGSIGNLSPYHYSVIFITAVLPLSIITTRSSKKPTPNPSRFDYAFALVVMVCGIYLIVNMDYLLTRISAVNPLTTIDLIVGVILIVTILELCRRTLGFGLTSILLFGLAYAYLGHLIPGTFGHRELPNQRILEEMIFTTNGIFGAPVQVAATYAFLFIMFGYFFKHSGAGQFIIDLCSSLVGRRTGGLAKVAVTTSGVFGSISGSPTADVAATGPINIPNMKRSGYDKTYAAAVEASASSGGTILPPIMGSVAFLMAEFTSIPYIDICIAALLGAILYYMGVYFQVHFRSIKLNMLGLSKSEIPNLWLTLKTGFYYGIPVITLVWALEQGLTPSLAACYGIVASFLLSYIRKSTWITPKEIITIFTQVVYHIVPLAVATAAAGIIIGIINLTGLAGKFTSLIFSITGEMVFLSLLVAAVICIILGMGMPTPSAYILVAALVAPALLQLGLDLLPVHLFLVFFCALSAITPPVGVAAYTAAGIAHANPLSVGLQATKLASVGFIIPFMFVYQPSLLLQGSVGEIVVAAVTALIGVYALAASMEGYMKGYLLNWERVILFIAAVAMIYPQWILNLFAAVIIGYFFIKGKARTESNQPNESEPIHSKGNSSISGL